MRNIVHPLILFLVATFIAACRSEPAGEATDLSLPDYQEGVSEIPSGSYVFIEYDTLETGSDGCGGGLLDFPHYSYSGVLGGYGGGNTLVEVNKDLPVFGFI